MAQGLHICAKYGIVYDLKFRPNKDCPVCHSGESVQMEKTIQ